MFEHREGHPAPPGAGTASRLPRGHGSLALSITGRDRFRPIARARHRNARLHARQRPDRRCLSIVRVTRHHPVLGLPLVCRAATIVSLYRSHRRDRFRPIARAIDIENGDCARSTAAGPPMFEHREGHPAPSGAGTASRLSSRTTIVSVYRSHRRGRFRDDARHRNRQLCALDWRPDRRCLMEHREAHPAPPGAGTASRLPRGHDRLALSLTVRRDRPFSTRTGRYIDIEMGLRARLRPDRRCVSIVRATRHHPVLAQPLACRAFTVVSLHRS
jgi:hypothetical protein